MLKLCILIAIAASVSTHPQGDNTGFFYHFGTLGSERSLQPQTPVLQVNDDPCNPSPCGPNTYCTISPSKGNAECRCVEGYFPKPDTIQGCGPQCTSDSQCQSHERCDRTKCTDVCHPSPCGSNTYCQSSNHRANCACENGFEGNAQTGCFPINREQPPVIAPPELPPFTGNPCSPNPCGLNTACRAVEGRPVCSCAEGYRGSPTTSCQRVGCLTNSECAPTQTCYQNDCVSPCQLQPCGVNAICRENNNHQGICSCPPDYTGDPFKSCTRFNPLELCRTQCGVNTDCDVHGRTVRCTCKSTYRGNPLHGCYRECESDSQCSSTMSCSRVTYTCESVCGQPGVCGEGAICRAFNHRAVCECPPNYQGNPQFRCAPECTRHSDCRSNLQCVNLRCVDPCIGSCGTNAECTVENHKPICKCPRGYTGHPFQHCRKFTPQDLCTPNPCGSNAVCTPGKDNSGQDRPVCTCPRGYIGDALRSCRPGECTTDAECGPHRACNSNFNCIDPCINACGINAECQVRNHVAQCSCPRGYVGSAFHQCTLEPDNYFIAGRTKKSLF